MPPLECYKLTLEYDGTRYHGWQSQTNTRTVQDAVSAAAREVLGVEVEVGGAGRTDAGVHALAQVAHLKIKAARIGHQVPGIGAEVNRTLVAQIRSPNLRDARPDTRHPTTDTRYRDSQSRNPNLLRDELNKALPSDIAVLSIERAARDFHARHHALRRYYLYQLATRKTAFSKRFVWWVKEPFDILATRKAVDILPGRHDFAAFGEKGGERKSTLVEVYECSLAVVGDLVLIRIGASHFLWKMVRRLVGSLVEIGRGNINLDAFEQMLLKKRGSAAPWTAPASGLFLEKVIYSEREHPGKLRPVMWA